MTTKIVSVLASLAVTQVAHADIIKCTFTEPFVSTEYSMAQQSLTIIDSFSEAPREIRTVIKDVSFQIKGPGQFELLDADHNVIQALTLNNQGSDGMSDFLYPFDVKWGHLYGGCESNFLHRTEH